MPNRYNYEARVTQLHTSAYNAALDTPYLIEYWAPLLMSLCPKLITREDVEVEGKFNSTKLIVSLINSQTKGSTEVINRLLNKYRQIDDEHRHIADVKPETIWDMVLDDMTPLPVEDD